MSHRNVIVSGGIFHAFDATSAALADVLAGVDVESDITEDVEAAFAAIARGEYDLLTVNALRWRMLDHDKYIPYRQQWAMEVSPAGRRAVEAFVRGGGALLGLHTAVICFDTWPAWGQLLGGHWVWGRSHHPPAGRVRVDPLEHELSADLAPLQLHDEIYHDLCIEAGVEPVLQAPTDAGPQTLMWRHRPGDGRAVTDTLGHDAASVRQPVHAELLRRSVRWLLDAH